MHRTSLRQKGFCIMVWVKFLQTKHWQVFERQAELQKFDSIVILRRSLLFNSVKTRLRKKNSRWSNRPSDSRLPEYLLPPLIHVVGHFSAFYNLFFFTLYLPLNPTLGDVKYWFIVINIYLDLTKGQYTCW